ncbi:MAG: double zinc ribbon domain-containing protein, partial [Primorskyibacter sp.]
MHVVFPPRCIACADLVADDFGLCGACWGQTPFLSGLVCDACGTPLPGSSPWVEHCDACLQTPPIWHRGRAALAYHGPARGLVLRLKHGDRLDVIRPAGQWMARAMRAIAPKDAMLVPVPLSRRRLRERRYNQALLLARAMGHHLNTPVLPDALIRPRHTKPLEDTDRAARYARLAGTIAPHPRA